jgi:UDP-2,3-diacylglucosamine pyrophosphatase LpxH
MSKIIVTSDQHLGYEHSNVSDFTNFLDFMMSRNDVQSLILLGDLIDMWRRDVSGLFLCFSEITKKLLDLRDSRKIDVYIVAGNHDYHLLNLQGKDYKFEFYLELPPAPTSDDSTKEMIASNKKYIFKHGWEFDLAQHPLIMEAMCHNMSDSAGHARSSIYNILQIAKDQFDKSLKEIIDFHNQRNGYVQNLLLPPEERLKSYLSDVEKKAHASVNDGETLVFGHTHRPFISSDDKIINTGSWVTEAEFHNTFVEIEDKEAKLFQFIDKQNIIDLTGKLRFSLS